MRVDPHASRVSPHVCLLAATDIVDRDLKSLRNARWEKAFKDNGSTDDISRDGCELSDHAAVNRKATIILEHLIQASDISHTVNLAAHCFHSILFIDCFVDSHLDSIISTADATLAYL